MSRFVTNNIKRIDLNKTEWIDLKEQLPFIEMQSILCQMDTENKMNNVKIMLPLLELAIVDWCLLGDKNEPVPFEKEKIKQLDINTILELAPIITDLYLSEEKKSSNQSEK